MARPEKPIDWALVDNLLVAGCMGTEICAHFDMHPNTFYAKIEEKYNMSFTQYSSEKKQKGCSILRAKQFEKAAKGDNTMLVWLGKNRLAQKDGDTNNEEREKEIKEKLDNCMNLMNQLQSSALKNESITKESE